MLQGLSQTPTSRGARLIFRGGSAGAPVSTVNHATKRIRARKTACKFHDLLQLALSLQRKGNNLVLAAASRNAAKQHKRKYAGQPMPSRTRDSRVGNGMESGFLPPSLLRSHKEIKIGASGNRMGLHYGRAGVG